MSDATYELGMVGLGVMGCNLVLNMADHGFAIAAFDKDPEKRQTLCDSGKTRTISVCASLPELFASLRRPRVVMMLVPAGPPVDSVLADLSHFLLRDDIVIDGADSHFSDTRLRQMTFMEDGIDLLGVGISGATEGARYGPSIMAGGPEKAYERVRPVFEAIAAKVDGEPCATYCGPSAAGHYVKMVHNGIEYGVMRLIAESYTLLKRCLGLSNDELNALFESWNETEIGGFLLEITAKIFLQPDEKTGQRLIDLIRPVAAQKGTGIWTSQDAMELHVPVPTIDAAVRMRDLSALESDRLSGSQVLSGPAKNVAADRETFLTRLRHALHAVMLLTYAQGMALLRRASEQRNYGLDLASIARVWRGGSIIRSRLLETVVTAYQRNPDLTTLLLDSSVAKQLSELHQDLRATVETAIENGIPTAAFMASLGYYDTYRTPRLAANLIQAQHDYFAADTYERIDARGVFHTTWKSREFAV